MSRYKPDTRAAFSRQPAHYLLFDVGQPMTSTQMRNAITAVQNVLMLACSIRGGSRIPAFGLAMINQNFQNVYSLEAIQGNFSKISAAFNSLSYQAKISEKVSFQEFKDYLYLAINSLLEDFKSKSEIMSGNNKWQFPPQMQITFVTAKDGSDIQLCLEEAVKTMNIAKLKKIQVVQLQNELGNLVTERNMEEPGQKINTNFLKGVEFVVLVQVAGTEKELESFFKTWLLDCDIDHEHLRISLPPSVDLPGSASPVLKCDIGECLINPLSLPFGHRYQIQMDFCSIQLGGSGLTKSAGMLLG
ncbi:hypothetical protein B7P43_G04989 [Cryptotermes secundus]|uniref:VWFA domain-containing protein n=1 Tax=Cryptotermes secundus TaxID=105785 RepID=A0A2J7PLW7_9NEOP|nr:hypothetical protein B7P43_G04989 [Cryptotermes secundus]